MAEESKAARSDDDDDAISMDRDDAALNDEAEAVAAEGETEAATVADDDAAEPEPEEPEPEAPPPEPTEEEKLALSIVQHFLLAAPPGEFEEVLADASALAPPGLLTPGLVAGIARARNAKQLAAATAADGTRVVLCPEAELTPTRYAAGGAVYDVDHVALTATPVAGADAAEGTAARAACQAALDAYAAARYDGGHAAVYDLPGGALKCVVRGDRTNLRNFYGGAWTSRWTATPSGDGFAVRGSVDVRAHYFEDGNVQLKTSKDVDAAAASPSDIARVVEAAESALHAGLESMYENMADQTFKAMRRVMPVTRAKMKWSVHELALNKNLRK